MEDVYLTIGDAEEAVQQRLADLLELRAADARQREMLDEYLGDVALTAGSRVLEIGCGTGAVVRRIAELFDGAEVIGIDPSPVFVEQARRLARGVGRVSFIVGDGRELPFEDGAFDAVVCHTSLCHIPGPERVLEEAARVSRPDGQLAVFDGDYATTTVATSPADPLQACADAAISTLVYDRYLVRRLGGLVRSAGLGARAYAESGLRPDRPAGLHAGTHRPGSRRACSRGPHRGRDRRGAQGRGPPASAGRDVLRAHRVPQPRGEKKLELQLAEGEEDALAERRVRLDHVEQHVDRRLGADRERQLPSHSPASGPTATAPLSTRRSGSATTLTKPARFGRS